MISLRGAVFGLLLAWLGGALFMVGQEVMQLREEGLPVLWHVVDRSELQPGDHIYCFRMLGLFSHHAIYEGNGMVIHFIGEYPSDAHVAREPLEKFLRYAKRIRRVLYGVRPMTQTLKFSGTAHVVQRDKPSEILNRARNALEEAAGWEKFHLRMNNCERFAFYCSTGLLDDYRNHQSNELPSFDDLLDPLGFVAKATHWFGKVIAAVVEFFVTVPWSDH